MLCFDLSMLKEHFNELVEEHFSIIASVNTIYILLYRVMIQNDLESNFSSLSFSFMPRDYMRNRILKKGSDLKTTISCDTMSEITYVKSFTEMTRMV